MRCSEPGMSVVLAIVASRAPGPHNVMKNSFVPDISS